MSSCAYYRTRTHGYWWTTLFLKVSLPKLFCNSFNIFAPLKQFLRQNLMQIRWCKFSSIFLISESIQDGRGCGIGRSWVLNILLFLFLAPLPLRRRYLRAKMKNVLSYDWLAMFIETLYFNPTFISSGVFFYIVSYQTAAIKKDTRYLSRVSLVKATIGLQPIYKPYKVGKASCLCIQVWSGGEGYHGLKESSILNWWNFICQQGLCNELSPALQKTSYSCIKIKKKLNTSTKGCM